MYRQRMEDSQLCTEAQHTQRVVSMSREVSRSLCTCERALTLLQVSRQPRLLKQELRGRRTLCNIQLHPVTELNHISEKLYGPDD